LKLPIVVILAGGYATRLGELAKETPKVLIPINGKPFLKWKLDQLEREGFKKIVLSVFHQSEKIERWIREQNYKNLKITFSHDGENPLGTGGAIRKIALASSEDLLVTYGDSYAPNGYKNFLANKERINYLGSIIIFKNHDLFDKSNISYVNGNIMSYSKIRSSEFTYNYIDYGASLLNPKLFSLIHFPKNFDLSLVFEKLIFQNDLYGYVENKRFYEIGSHSGIIDFDNFAQKTLKV